jgi:hypothetical protein
MWLSRITVYSQDLHPGGRRLSLFALLPEQGKFFGWPQAARNQSMDIFPVFRYPLAGQKWLMV